MCVCIYVYIYTHRQMYVERDRGEREGERERERERAPQAVRHDSCICVLIHSVFMFYIVFEIPHVFVCVMCVRACECT